MVLVDALRYDFVFGNSSRMTFTQRHVESPPLLPSHTSIWEEEEYESHDFHFGGGVEFMEDG